MTAKWVLATSPHDMHYPHIAGFEPARQLTTPAPPPSDPRPTPRSYSIHNPPSFPAYLQRAGKFTILPGPILTGGRAIRRLTNPLTCHTPGSCHTPACSAHVLQVAPPPGPPVGVVPLVLTSRRPQGSGSLHCGGAPHQYDPEPVRSKAQQINALLPGKGIQEKLHGKKKDCREPHAAGTLRQSGSSG